MRMIPIGVVQRDTTWCWLEDDGTPTALTYPVRIVVLDEGGAYQVRAYRQDTGAMIADEVIRGRHAKARALAFAATGWAEFEAVEPTRATA